MAQRFKSIVLSLSSVLAFSVSSLTAAQASATCPPEKLSFEGWENWDQITREPVKSVGHSDNWVGIFVNPLARETYLQAGTPYQECAAIIKPVYSGPDEATVTKLTIMVKMPAGFDSENGDWWYASADPTGTKIVPKLSRRACIACHEQAKETDYLFSNEVLEAVAD